MVARTVPTMPTWLSGQKITSTLLNQISTFGNFWANPPEFRMYQGVAQSIPNAAVTTLTMDTPDSDTDSGRAVGTPWSYTIPAGMSGRWQFTVDFVLSASGGNEGDAILQKNGTTVTGVQATNNTTALRTGLIIQTIRVNAGDVMTAAAFQQSGAAVNTFVSATITSSFEGRLVSLANP